MLKAHKMRRFDNPTVVDEENLRKLNEIIGGRIREKTPDARLSFNVAFEDGSFYETDSLDQILAEENPSHRMIQEVDFSAGHREGYYILATFRSDSEHPVSYDVRGPDRDWVYLTCADIDDRLSKMRAPGKVLHVNLDRGLFAITLLGLVLVTFAATAHFAVRHGKGISSAKTLEERLEAVTQQINQLNAVNDAMLRGLAWSLAGGACVLFSILLLVPQLRKLFPLATFAIGDQLKKHHGRQRARQNLLWGVLVAFAVCLISGYLVGRR